MSSTTKPKIVHPLLSQNSLGLIPRDYEGAMSTLCAGCGHDSITASLIQALFELAIPPHRLIKLSGIGCSSKTTAYFASTAHGLNAVHGRMPSIATGAHAANRELYCVGISGDGDSLSIGLGQFVHAARRNLHMLYILENNGVYGLTKGQFSASADVGSKLKSGEENPYEPVDPVLLAISIGATFVARSFSGDKKQLVPLLKAGLLHSGFAFIDVISPCVSFNDHESSTKGYISTRENVHEVIHMDFVPGSEEITADYEADTAQTVRLHDGSSVVLKKTAEAYSPTDPIKAHAYIREHQLRGQVVTGLLYIDESASDFHARSETVAVPLVDLPYERLHPGSAGLEEFQSDLR
jgi:2-oxoglutarate ferredoxin oxidoreductase subunit beta